MAYVRVIDWDCDDCIGALRRVSQQSNRDNKIADVPEDWLGRECPHGRSGVQLEVLKSYLPSVDEWKQREHPEGASPGPAEVGDLEAPDGGLNRDGSKDIGYPAREAGKYGSYPSHDRFDDDSDP